jgi:hypothetical protein
MAKAKVAAPVVAPVKVKKVKGIICDACGGNTQTAELFFNEAEHTHNVCASCVDMIQDDLVAKKVASLVAKGTSAKAAGKKVAGMDLESAVLKAAIKLIEQDNPDDEEVEDIELTSLVEDDTDTDEDELDDEIATRKPVGKAKKEKAVAAPVAVEPVKKSKKTKAEPAVPVKVLSPRQQKLADRAARKEAKLAAEAAAAAAPVKKSKKEKVVSESKAAATPVKEMSARQQRLAARAARKAAKSAGASVAPVAPAKKEKLGATGGKDVIITMEQARVEKFVRLAIKEVTEAMSTMKVKKGTDTTQLKIDAITTAFETRLSNAFVKDFKAAAKENGFVKDIKALIASA